MQFFHLETISFIDEHYLSIENIYFIVIILKTILTIVTLNKKLANWKYV